MNDRTDGKKSFVLYCDYSEHIALLSDEDAGQLFKAVFGYVMDGNISELSPIALMAFSFIKAQLDRDLEKWEEVRNKRAIAGSLGGKAKGKKQKVAKEANAISAKQKVAKEAVTDNGTEYVNVTDNVDVTDNAKCNTYFSQHELNQAFLDFIEMRKKIKKPMTKRGIELAIKKLHELANIPFSDEINVEVAIKILENSILNNYQGLFPLKTENKTSGEGKSISNVWENA